MAMATVYNGLAECFRIHFIAVSHLGPESYADKSRKKKELNIKINWKKNRLCDFNFYKIFIFITNFLFYIFKYLSFD